MHKKKTISAIFFDLGGVIVKGPPTNTGTAIKKACRKWMHSGEYAVDDILHEHCRGTISRRDVATSISKKFHLPASAKKSISYILSPEWYKKTIRINRGALALVSSLSKRYVVGVISDTIPVHTNLNRKFGIFKYFHPIILSHVVGAVKPEPAMYRAGLHKARVTPQEAVFIDDRPVKLAGATRLGMHGILFKSLPQLKRSLRRLGVIWK